MPGQLLLWHECMMPAEAAAALGCSWPAGRHPVCPAERLVGLKAAAGQPLWAAVLCCRRSSEATAARCWQCRQPVWCACRASALLLLRHSPLPYRTYAMAVGGLGWRVSLHVVIRVVVAPCAWRCCTACLHSVCCVVACWRRRGGGRRAAATLPACLQHGLLLLWRVPPLWQANPHWWRSAQPP